MKITKDKKIEPCCEWTKRWLGYFEVDGGKIVMLDVHGNPVHKYSPVNFCPFCGAKTEVEK